MGDKIQLIALDVIQGGLLQMDILNENTGKRDRMFVEPDFFFKMLGDAMEKNFMNTLKKEWDEAIIITKEEE